MMKNVRIEHKKRTYHVLVPGSPEELSEAEWLLIYKMKSQESPLVDIQLYILLQRMANVPQKVIKSIDDESMYDLCQILTYIQDDLHPANCPIKSIQFKWQKFAPPATLDELSGAEYAIVESCFTDMKELNDEFYLFKLMAVIYRPCNYLGKRQAFNDEDLDNRAHLFMTMLGIEHAWLISDWYRNWHAQLEEEYPEVFNGEESKIKSEGFVEVIYSMAGVKLGLVSAVMQQDIKSILLAATLEILANKRIKAASKGK